ncbi:glycosyltransferase [Bacillus pacificus]
MRPFISACIIVKNEEEMLRNCLESIRSGVDEIIIVDTGSTDSTKKIAREFTKKVYDYEWENDFSAARNLRLLRQVVIG